MPKRSSYCYMPFYFIIVNSPFFCNLCHQQSLHYLSLSKGQLLDSVQNNTTYYGTIIMGNKFLVQSKTSVLVLQYIVFVLLLPVSASVTAKISIHGILRKSLSIAQRRFISDCGRICGIG